MTKSIITTGSNYTMYSQHPIWKKHDFMHCVVFQNIYGAYFSHIILKSVAQFQYIRGKVYSYIKG